MIYRYLREQIAEGNWDIDHPDRGTTLAEDIGSALPGKEFTILCNASLLRLDFPLILSGADNTTLDTTVSNHKNNL